MRARRATTAARCCVLGLCAALAGCASPVARRPVGPDMGRQGAAWEVVIPGGQTGPELAMDWEYSRRDEALSYRDESTLTDADKPSLDNAEYLFIPRRTDLLIYFPPAGSPGIHGAYRWRW